MKYLVILACLGILLFAGYKYVYPPMVAKNSPENEKAAEQTAKPEATPEMSSEQVPATGANNNQLSSPAANSTTEQTDEKLLASMKEEYKCVKCEYFKLGKEKGACCGVLKTYSSTYPEQIEINPELQKKAIELKKQKDAKLTEIASASKDVNQYEKDLREVNSKLWKRQGTDARIGWRYRNIDPLDKVRPMSTLNSRNRKKAIAYIYKEDSRKEEAVTEVTQKLTAAQKKYTDAKKEYAELDKNYAKLKLEYKRYLETQVDEYEKKMTELKAKGMALKDKIKEAIKENDENILEAEKKETPDNA